jgi:hypothetical protein
MKTKDNAESRRVELAGYEGWTLGGYAWRSGHVKSPLTGGAMRAVVGTDVQGRYRPGVRTTAGPESASEVTTAFDVKPVHDKSAAIVKAQEMFRSELVDHARQAAERTQKPGEIVSVQVESRALAIAEGRDNGAAAKYGANTAIGCDAPSHRRSR